MLCQHCHYGIKAKESELRDTYKYFGFTIDIGMLPILRDIGVLKCSIRITPKLHHSKAPMLDEHSLINIYSMFHKYSHLFGQECIDGPFIKK